MAAKWRVPRRKPPTPKPAPPKLIRELAAQKALTQLGVKEVPPGSNWGPQVSKYLESVGLGPNPWCLAFVHWSYIPWARLAGGGLVQAFEAWARGVGDIVSRPLKWDIVCYDWNADNWDDHVGIVLQVLGLRWIGGSFVGYIKTIEGNTGIGNDSNGGEVMIRYRWVNAATAFVRVKGTAK